MSHTECDAKINPEDDEEFDQGTEDDIGSVTLY
jgi:hypothetical protein